MQGVSPSFQGLEAGPVGSSNRWKPGRRSSPSIARTTPRRFAPRVLCRQAASKAVILPAIARATVVRDADARSPLPKAMNRASRAVTVHAHGIARATVVGDADGCLTRYHPHVTAPAKQVRAVPLTPAGTAAAEQPRSSPQPRRRPRRPRQRPRQQSCHGLCSIPRRSRAHDGGASAPGQPRSGFRGVALSATSSMP